jgi:hypothetical protein
MRFGLGSGISYCETGGRLVFLDRRRDRYFCLSESSELCVRRFIEGRSLEPEDKLALDRLTEGGILDRTSGPELSASCPQPPAPVRAVLDESRRPRFATLCRALFGLAASSLELKLRSLDRCLARIERRKSRLKPCRERSSSDATEIALAFNWTSLLLPSLDRCLPRSFALAHALLDSGIPPTLVLGVRLPPFAAHCWVQDGDVILNESLDQAGTFTPILVT